MPVGPAKFDVNRCNKSPLQGEKPDFWPVSKFNTGSFPLRGILPVTKLERKASSDADQCIPAGSSVSLVSTEKGVNYSVNNNDAKYLREKSASDCLRFVKSRAQFCESRGATYRRIWEMFSAVQSTSGRVTDVENSVQNDAQLAILSYLKLVRN